MTSIVEHYRLGAVPRSFLRFSRILKQVRNHIIEACMLWEQEAQTSGPELGAVDKEVIVEQGFKGWIGVSQGK